MDFANRIRTHAEPAGITPISPMRFGTVTGETYGGRTVTVPVAVVARAPAPPASASWLCVRQAVGPEQEWLALVPADQVRAN